MNVSEKKNQEWQGYQILTMAHLGEISLWL